MVIKRGKKEIRLTPEELRQAHEEQQRVYDRQNITENLDWIMDGVACELGRDFDLEGLRSNDAFVELAAKVSREKQDSEDIAFTAAIQIGVKNAIKEVVLCEK